LTKKLFSRNFQYNLLFNIKIDVVRHKITIGNECIIGAGAVLLENAAERNFYPGEPVKLFPISSDKLPLG